MVPSCRVPYPFLDNFGTGAEKHLLCLITLVESQQPIDEALKLEFGEERIAEITADCRAKQFGISLNLILAIAKDRCLFFFGI